MATVITAVETHDVRFPTSRYLDGSDAMNRDPDYSAAYVVLRTSDGDAGYGLAFTIGRGTEVETAAIDAFAPLVVGLPVADVLGDLGDFARLLTGDSPMRWLGPEKGVAHMAVGAILNAAWDLAARRAGLPLWHFLSTLSPRQLVSLIDFRYIDDELTPDEALDILSRAEAGRPERIAQLQAVGYPAYATSPGWLGYRDEKLVRLSRDAVAEGFGQVKIKVGASLDDDRRRLTLAREAVGPNVRLAADANQVWGVQQAIAWIRELDGFDLYWMEEPTSPDDILGTAAIRKAVSPVRVAAGEHIHNRVMFKQFLQAEALDVVQIDATRVGGVNENLAILLLAAKHHVPVCPHAGGVGLCEAVQHLAMFDYVAVSGTFEDRLIEYADHLHDHFTDPVRLEHGRYLAPTAPGFSTQFKPESIAAYEYPDGQQWKAGMVEQREGVSGG